VQSLYLVLICSPHSAKIFNKHFLSLQGNKVGDMQIILADGVYQIQKTLNDADDNISLISKSGNRNDVVISGCGMRKTKRVDNLIRVSGKHLTLDGITLQQAGNHLIQIAGEQNADFPHSA
jgi:hypothetical protein